MLILTDYIFGERFVYYECTNRDLKIRPIYECRSDESLKTKSKELKRLTYTGFLEGLEHLKIETDENVTKTRFKEKGEDHVVEVEVSTVRFLKVNS